MPWDIWFAALCNRYTKYMKKNLDQMHKSKLSLPWLIELAKVRLEDDGYEVVQGIISPVADNYVATLAVTSATKKKLASAEHRVLMCQKAVSDSGIYVHHIPMYIIMEIFYGRATTHVSLCRMGGGQRCGIATAGVDIDL